MAWLQVTNKLGQDLGRATGMGCAGGRRAYWRSAAQHLLNQIGCGFVQPKQPRGTWELHIPAPTTATSALAAQCCPRVVLAVVYL